MIPTELLLLLPTVSCTADRLCCGVLRVMLALTADDDNDRSGYFTSRPSLKRYTRVSSQLLNAARHWFVFSGSLAGDAASVERLWSALSVVQHHDAVAGTARQAVTDDYSQRLSRGGAEADAAMQRTIAQIVSAGNSSHAALLPFVSCPLANYTVCPASQQSAAVVVLLYNPLARERVELHSVPVTVTQSGGLAVYDSQGRVQPSQVVAVPSSQAVWPGQSASAVVQWLASVPALGFETYFIVTQKQHDGSAVAVSADEQLHKAARTKRLSGMRAEVDGGDEAQAADSSIENSRWRLTFNGTSGQLQSALDKQTNVTHPFTISFLYYKSRVGRNGSSSPYSFAPDGDPIDLSPFGRLTAVVQQPIAQQLSVNVTDWLSYTVRLVNDTSADEGAGGSLLSRAIEVEYVVGPVPTEADGVGKEVIVRYHLSSLNNSGVFYTDSNGREYQRRVRNQRPSFNLTLTEPVSSNYYPVVTTALLRDADTGLSLYVLTDRANGGSSLTDGSVELMLHRRLVNKALAGEALDELQFGRGLVIRGSHSLIIGSDDDARPSLTSAATAARLVQSRLYAPLSASYAPLTESVPSYIAAHIVAASYCSQPLPPSVELISLYWQQAAGQEGGSVIMRLAHSFGVDESSSPYASAVTVDLAALFTQSIANITEVSLTANRNRADMERDRKKWRAQGQQQQQQQQRAADADVDGLGAKRDGVRSMAGLWSDGRNVTIAPMEVRTFNITFST